MNRRRMAFGATAIAATALAVTACSATVRPPASPPAATFSASAVTLAGCRALAQWENGPSTGAGADAAISTQVQAIIARARGTRFAAAVNMWVTDLRSGDIYAAEADSGAVDASCAAVGILNVIGGPPS